MTPTISALPNGDKRLDTAADLLAALSTAPETFLQPSHALHVAAILAAKRLLDPLASDIVDLQTGRRQSNLRKRKRLTGKEQRLPLQVRQIHTNGFGTKQIWEQGKRVLDAAQGEINADIDELERRMDGKPFHKDVPDASNDFDHQDDVSEVTEEDVELDDDEEMTRSEGGLGSSPLRETLLNESALEDEDGLTDDPDDDVQHPPDTYVRDPNKLNDGFFSIDDFNKQTSFLEQQDALGEDDNPSDEDEVDWTADPLAIALSSTARREATQPNDVEEDDIDEDLPTFGDADLNASDSDEEDDRSVEPEETGGTGPDLSNANDIMYADFFEAPPKRQSKSKRMRPLPKTQPTPLPDLRNEDNLNNDIQRAISDVRRDIFDSEAEISEWDEEDDASIDSQAAARHASRKSASGDLSTHEKQRAKIASEIRRLEALNVSKRDWQLLGEARAPDRPLNSLIEEDLDFEHAGKPVPVITAEVSEEIEALIKRRIVAREFDEVIRRRPDAAGLANETRRGAIELKGIDDNKSKQGLAEVYEAEHLRQTDPNYVDPRDKAKKRAHEEIGNLWKEVSYQLDVLTNLHFKPKRVEIEVKSVEDKPVIAMGDARPVGGESGDQSRLAPQEVWKAGNGVEEKRRVAVGRKDSGGVSVNREEMSREEKLRRRRREKERAKKAKENRVLVGGENRNGDGVYGKQSGKARKKDEKEDIFSQLKKGGVKVVGRKGEMQELGTSAGKGTRAATEANSSTLKL